MGLNKSYVRWSANFWEVGSGPWTKKLEHWSLIYSGEQFHLKKFFACLPKCLAFVIGKAVYLCYTVILNWNLRVHGCFFVQINYCV